MERSGKARCNGQELYFEVHGQGAPLVLVMGIGYDSGLWTLAQVPALSRDFRVVIFDNRDAGRSARAAGPYAIADMADDVAGLMDALDLKRAHVLGLSMGGFIAQELALRHAARVDRLVLAGCGPGPAGDAFDPIRTWDWVKSRDETGELFAAQQLGWLFSAAFRRNAPAVQQTLALLAQNPHPVDAAAYHRQAEAYGKYASLDRLAGIEAPTLVLTGEQDLVTPPWVCREVADRIPDAELEVVGGDGSSHVMALERPDDFNRVVTRFLTRPRR